MTELKSVLAFMQLAMSYGGRFSPNKASRKVIVHRMERVLVMLLNSTEVQSMVLPVVNRVTLQAVRTQQLLNL